MSNLTTAITQQDAAAVEAAAPRTPVALLQSDTALQMIAESLPAHMDAKTFQRHAITLVKQTPTLLECEAASVAQGIVRGAALGLDPDPALGQMWLVPRNVKDGNTWTKVATFQVGWRGLYELAMRTGRVASLEVKPVHRHDRFEARIGTNGGLVHEPDWFGSRGDVVGWYAYARLASGVEMFEVLSVADAERHRDAFASSKTRDGKIYGPWADHFEAMAQKTVFLKLAKWLPKQVERDALTEALEADGQAVRTPLQGVPGRGDIIEATHEPDPAPELAAGPVEPPDVATVPEGAPLADENGEPILATAKPAAKSTAATSERNKRMWAMVNDAWPDDTKDQQDVYRRALIGVVHEGASSSMALAPAEWDDLFVALEEIGAGRSELHLRSNGAWELRATRGAA